MRQKGLIFLILLCLLGGQLFDTKQVNAASCNIILSMEEDTVLVGDSFIMTVQIDAEDSISGVELLLTYDSDALEYTAGSPAVSGEEGTLRISDLDMAADRTSVKYVIKFEIKKATVSYVKVNSNASIYNETSGQSMSVASNVLAVVGKANEEASDNAFLASLKINEGTLNPEFSAEVTEYNVTMEEELPKLIISAQAQDPSAKVEVNGANDLHAGENEITIIVTAESGDTYQYTLHVYYEESVEEEKKEEPVPTPEVSQESSGLQVFELQPITAKEVEGSILLTTYTHFTVEELTEKSLLPRGYEETSILIDGYAVKAYQYQAEKSDFVLIYASSEGTEPTFYQYDMVGNTLQRLNRLLLVEDAVDVEVETKVSDTNEGISKVYSSLLIGFVILTILFMGTTAMLYRKINRRKRR